MTSHYCSHSICAGIFGLALASALGQALASDAARSPLPGYDRVGKPIISGMRGAIDESGAESRGHPLPEADPANKALNKRKTELSKRMFWIMMSMR